MADTTPEKAPETPKPYVHTYQGDLDKALDTTEASVVQTLMREAREREALERENRTRKRERKWYKAGGILLVLLALGALGYAVYYFRTLTVPVAPTYSVGVFSTTEAFAVEDSSLSDVIQTLMARVLDTKPILVQLTKAGLPIDPATFFTFLGSAPSEPFVHTLYIARLGFIKENDALVPFVIVATPDPILARKEFLIAEGKLLSYFGALFTIPKTTETAFTSAYLYNLPVRILRDVDGKPALLYGSIADTIFVITQSPEAFKSAYEEVLQGQH